MTEPIKITILVCGYCRAEGRSPDEEFRASDSEAGRNAIRQHAYPGHGIEVGAKLWGEEATE